MKRKRLCEKRLGCIFIAIVFLTTVFTYQAVGSWTTNGPAALGTYDVAVDPKNSNVVYMVGDTGAIYKSVDGGFSFTENTNYIPANEHMRNIAFRDSSYGYATGFSFYKTTDAGTTWEEAGFGLPYGPYIQSGHTDILVDRVEPNIVYVSTYAYDVNTHHLGGVYKSIDYGDTFLDITPSDVDDFRVSSLTIDATNNHIIYAGVYMILGCENGGVWRSDDGGESWVQHTYSAPYYVVTSVKADSIAPGRVFAGTMGSLGCCRSDDYGETWEQVLSAGGDDIAIRGSTVFVASNGLYRSFESGDEDSWIELSNGIPTSGFDVVDIASTDQNIVFIGGNEWHSLYRSNDCGDSFSAIAVTDSPGITIAYVASSLQIPSTVVYSGTDLPTPGCWGTGIFKTANNGNTWTQTTYPTIFEITDLVVCPTNPDIIMATYYDWECMSRGTKRSTDGGATFSSLTSVRNVLRMAFNPQNSQQVYASSDPDMNDPYRFYRSNDAGATWSPISSSGINYNARALLIHAYEGTDILYTGTGNGIYKSVDGGVHWTHVGLQGLEVTSLSHCFLESGGIVAGAINGVYRSIDNGQTWSLIGLSGIQINDVFSEIIETRYLYIPEVYYRPILWAATDQGVFEYIAGDWEDHSWGLDSLEVRDLTLTKPIPVYNGQIQTTPSLKDLIMPINSHPTTDPEGIWKPNVEPSIIPIRRSILHAATPTGTYEYVFNEPC